MWLGRSGVLAQGEARAVELERLLLLIRELEAVAPPQVTKRFTGNVFRWAHLGRSLFFKRKFPVHPKKLATDPAGKFLCWSFRRNVGNQFPRAIHSEAKRPIVAMSLKTAIIVTGLLAEQTIFREEPMTRFHALAAAVSFAAFTSINAWAADPLPTETHKLLPLSLAVEVAQAANRLLCVLCTLLKRQTLFDADYKNSQIAAAAA
jgi:hypothetical protein